jgi:hypothetical protein
MAQPAFSGLLDYRLPRLNGTRPPQRRLSQNSFLNHRIYLATSSKRAITKNESLKIVNEVLRRNFETASTRRPYQSEMHLGVSLSLLFRS